MKRPKLVYDMKFADYQAAPGLNASVLKAGMKSMRHAKFALDFVKEETPAMAWGRAIHSYVLDVEEFENRYVVWSGGRRSGKEFDKFSEANQGKEILKAEEVAELEQIRERILADRQAAEILGRVTHREVSCFWEEDSGPLDGTKFKARFDAVGPGLLVDLKTSHDIGRRVFEAQSYKLGYHLQMGLYAHALGLLPPNQKGEVALVAVETKEPYDVCVFDCSDAFLQRGIEEALAVAEEIVECWRTNMWPGQYSCRTALELPSWVAVGEPCPYEELLPGEL